MRIVHEDGEWIINRGWFPMADPTQNILFEPGEKTCVRLSDWLKMQTGLGLFEAVASPLGVAKPSVVDKPQPTKVTTKVSA